MEKNHQLNYLGSASVNEFPHGAEIKHFTTVELCCDISKEKLLTK